jgi:hypothetical protein
VLVVTRLLFKDGIQLNGLPASPAEITDAYSPFHPAGQPFHRIQPHPQRQRSHHSHPTIGRSVSAQEPRLSPHALTGATVQRGGRSFLRQQCPKPSASSPTHKTIFMVMEIKIVICSIFSEGFLRHSNAYIFRLVFYIIGDQVDRIDLHKTCSS